MVSNLDKEYMSTNTIYEQQKEYRKTPEGKLAIKRANEKQLVKKMTTYNCGNCGEDEFEPDVGDIYCPSNASVSLPIVIGDDRFIDSAFMY